MEYYSTVFKKDIPPDLITCVEKFHPHVKDIDITQTLKTSKGKLNIFITYKLIFNDRNDYNYNFQIL